MITAKASVAADPFQLQRRQAAGGTKPLGFWGFKNETDTLTDVLLGPADNLSTWPPARCRARPCASIRPTLPSHNGSIANCKVHTPILA